MVKLREKNNLSKSERDAFALVGRIGGKENVRKNGLGHMKRIAKKGAEARWGKKKLKN